MNGCPSPTGKGKPESGIHVVPGVKCKFSREGSAVADEILNWLQARRLVFVG